jgi:hypothetical protein
MANELTSSVVRKTPPNLVDKLTISSLLFTGNSEWGHSQSSAKLVDTVCNTTQGPPYSATVEIAEFSWVTGYSRDAAMIVPVGPLAMHSPSSCAVQSSTAADLLETTADVDETEVFLEPASVTVAFQPHGARFSTEIYTLSRYPLDPTHVRLKLLHACDQWHYSRVFTPLSG